MATYAQHAALNPEHGAASPEERMRERAVLDRSCRTPCLVFFVSSIFWLIVGTLFALIASTKLHTPEFMVSLPWIGDVGALTFGRIRPAHLNAVIYGWSSTAAIAVCIWLMARLCRVPVMHSWILVTAGVLWNLGVLIGIGGILLGHSTSVEWLEMPTQAAFLLFVSYALMSVWAVMMFVNRKPGHIFVSQWYIFGALFWFPWLYGCVQILLLLQPVEGSVQGIINWWFAHNVLGLWFTPIGLATAYYLIPKVIGKPIHSYYLSILGFWTLALFYSWNGGHHLVNGPVPAWIVSVSIIASAMMLIPVVTVAINHHLTMRGHFHMLKTSPTLRFVVFGAMSYTLASLQGILMAFRSFNEVTHFTHYTIGHSHVGMYMFFTMMMFGAMYYIMPRLVGWEWPSARLIKIHFWCTALGGLLMVGVLTLGGVQQGLKLVMFWLKEAPTPENPTGVPYSFMEILEATKPWLWLRTISGILILVGHFAFAINFFLMLARKGEAKTSPTLLGQKTTQLQPQMT
jgi:cytochrome c oxidase cbb3-type subunit 1